MWVADVVGYKLKCISTAAREMNKLANLIAIHVPVAAKMKQDNVH